MMNSNEIIKYHNDMNALIFTNFNEVDFNIFFSICYKLKDKGLNKVDMSFDEFRKLAHYTSRDNKRLRADLKRTYTKILKLVSSIKVNEDEEVNFTLFTEFIINSKIQSVSIQTNEKFEYILNGFSFNFTRFELKEFCNLDSRYSKTLYRHLKQFRLTGYVIFEWDTFLKILDVPLSYKTNDIEKRIIKRALDDLSPYFKNLRVAKKKERKRGSKITHIEFLFDKEINFAIDKNPSLFDYELTEFQQKLNSFIGAKLEGRNIIESIRVSGDIIICETAVGEYKFRDLETIKAQIGA